MKQRYLKNLFDLTRGLGLHPEFDTYEEKFCIEHGSEACKKRHREFLESLSPEEKTQFQELFGK